MSEPLRVKHAGGSADPSGIERTSFAGRHADLLGLLIGQAHPAWQPTLALGLQAVARATPDYLPDLLDGPYLPTENRLFAAFSQAPDTVRHVLVGEGPYPRAASATGVCFMDGAVGSLWCATGLSKAVNRATSLRNFMKMLLVADGQLSPDHTAGDALAGVATRAASTGSPLIGSLPELQSNLLAEGFLLLNAALVFRPEVRPAIEARAWQPFIETILIALRETGQALGRPLADLVLWGKIANQVESLPVTAIFPKRIAEHPYNLSFIRNQAMQDFFGPMRLLQRRD